jgi:serine/threonine protein kinase
MARKMRERERRLYDHRFNSETRRHSQSDLLNEGNGESDRSSSYSSLPGFEAGEIVAGKYKTVSRLGVGGMGAVYRVQQVFLDKEFALKTLDGKKISDKVIRRFQLEARAASSLNHPNLVQVHDFGLLGDNLPYLVMDLVEGVTLAQYLRECGPLSVEQVAPLFAQVCSGLSAAHSQGVIHRDIKPSNIMLVSGMAPGTEGSVKLLDFGIAKLTATDHSEIQALTRSGEIFGSPLYMSPEHCAGGLVDHRSDIYSFGCVLFEALTGTPPHVGHNALSTMMRHQLAPAPTLKEASLGKEFPLALEKLVANTLHKSPWERYQNLDEIAHDLATLHTIASSEETQTNACVSPRANSTRTAKVISLPAHRFYLLLAASIISSASVTGSIVYLSKTNASPQLPASTPISSTAKNNSPAYTDDNIVSAVKLFGPDEEREARDSAILKACPPITATTIIGKDGVRQRKIEFPSCGIGALFEGRHFRRIRYLGQARGTVQVPSDPRLTLLVRVNDYPATLNAPQLFAACPNDLFFGLAFSGSGLSLDQGKVSETDRIAVLLDNAEHWAHLRSLALHNVPLNQRIIDAITKIEALRYLDIIGPTDAVQALADSNCIPRLQGLNLSKLNCEPILRKLKNSNSIAELCIDDASLRPETLQYLRHCPNLQYLQLSGVDINLGLTKSITQIPSISVVYLTSKATKQALMPLIEDPAIRCISLERKSQTSETIEELQNLSSKIEIAN